MLEKPGAPNIGAFEKKGKPHDLSGHWKPIKTLLLKKITGGGTKKNKKIDWNTSFNKNFDILSKIR